jgi:hypothetical protein
MGLICGLDPGSLTLLATSLAAPCLALQEITLGDGPDTRLLKLTGRLYYVRDAYAALDTAGDTTDTHG